MENIKIYPGYQGIAKDITKSEVIANQVEGGLSKTDVTDVELAEMPDIIEKWGSFLKENNITLSDEVVRGYADLSYYLFKHDQEDLLTLLFETVVKTCTQVHVQAMSPAYVLSRLDKVAEKIEMEVSKMEEVNKHMRDNMPRSVIKPKRKNTSEEVVPLPPKFNRNEERKQKEQVHYKDQSMDVDPVVTTGNKVERVYNALEKGKEKMYEVVDDPETTDGDPSYDHIDPASTEGKRLRDEFTKFYTCDEYNELSEESQISVFNYFVQHVLNVNVDASVYKTALSALTALINKRTLLDVVEKVRLGTLTSVDLQDACDEIAYAMKVCGPVFGKMKASVVKEGDVFSLHIDYDGPNDQESTSGSPMEK